MFGREAAVVIGVDKYGVMDEFGERRHVNSIFWHGQMISPTPKIPQKSFKMRCINGLRLCQVPGKGQRSAPHQSQRGSSLDKMVGLRTREGSVTVETVSVQH